MAEPPVVQIRLMIDTQVDPIRGRLQADGVPGREFSGWLELASLLERIRTAAAPAPSPD